MQRLRIPVHAFTSLWQNYSLTILHRSGAMYNTNIRCKALKHYSILPYIAIERFPDHGSHPALKVHLHEIFDLQFFFHQKKPPGLLIQTLNYFQDKFEFVKIFKFESYSMYVRVKSEYVETIFCQASANQLFVLGWLQAHQVTLTPFFKVVPFESCKEMFVPYHDEGFMYNLNTTFINTNCTTKVQSLLHFR